MCTVPKHRHPSRHASMHFWECVLLIFMHMRRMCSERYVSSAQLCPKLRVLWDYIPRYVKHLQLPSTFSRAWSAADSLLTAIIHKCLEAMKPVAFCHCSRQTKTLNPNAVAGRVSTMKYELLPVQNTYRHSLGVIILSSLMTTDGKDTLWTYFEP